MKLIEAKTRIDKLANIKFENFLSPEDIKDAMLIINKGRTGQLLELTIGLKLSNNKLDFEDGELKTNKCNKNGEPKETMFITQVNSMIDEMLVKKNFYETELYKKIKNILYVPISKDGPVSEWMYLPCIEINLESKKYEELLTQLESDYYYICEQLNKQLNVSSNATLHTTSGKFIQIRTKDSKPYHPIYSKTYNRIISDKNRAFYFKIDFMKYINNINNIK